MPVSPKTAAVQQPKKRCVKIDDVFGKWVVLSGPNKRGRSSPYWMCRCKCGLEKEVREDHLLTGMSNGCRPCGVLGVPHHKKRRWPYDDNKHPKRLRTIVASAISRCTDPDYNGYIHWGGRGISVCNLWMDNPLLFVEYLLTLEGSGNLELMLDRIDNDGNYEPGNLRFTTYSVSNHNKRYRGRYPQ